MQEEVVGAGWRLVEDTDDFSGKNTSFAILESDKIGLSITDAPIAAFVRCDGDGGYYAYVLSGGYIGARRGRMPVRYKFGEDEPVSERWNESTSGKAAFLPEGYRDFLSGLQGGEDFLFEITDYRGGTYSARFEGAGSGRDALDFVFGGCQ